MKTVFGLFNYVIILTILIIISFFHVSDVQAANKASHRQEKESSLKDKINANFYVYYDRIGENKVISKGYDMENKKCFINTEFNPDKVKKTCLAFWLNSETSICFYGKMVVGERAQPGTYFYYKTQLISITNSDGHENKIEILPYYIVTENGLKLHPIAFVTKMNEISNKIYFMLDSNKEVIEWGIEVNGKKKRQPIEIPIELKKHRMFCVANGEIVCDW